MQPADRSRLIKTCARELGFDACGITGTDLKQHPRRLRDWLAAGNHGEMTYMARHGVKRERPERLIPGTAAIISVAMNYLPPDTSPATTLLATDRAYVARYALGRDYHRVIRQRLRRLVDRIRTDIDDTAAFRIFTDSAPVLERGIGEQAGLGWIGKNTMLLDRELGSFFFLGEVFTDLALEPDPEMHSNHCGSCTRCIDICPSAAIVSPNRLDARRCISYFTIELKGSIPPEHRPQMGNRIFGCDDCQLICPYNREGPVSPEPDFIPRERLHEATLVELFSWTEDEFLTRTAGSPIRRAGYVSWLRNIAVAMGNAPQDSALVAALEARADDPSGIVREHVQWALARQRNRQRNERADELQLEKVVAIKAEFGD